MEERGVSDAGRLCKINYIPAHQHHGPLQLSLPLLHARRGCGKARARRFLFARGAAGYGRRGCALRRQEIRVTGGEPLVRRGAVDFCRMLSEIPGVEELCVTTNGSLLKEVARPLRDAGVTHLNISLDTLNEERFRAITRLGTLQDVLDGIDAAERAGFAKIKLNCVLLGGVNDDEITDFVALTREHPWQVRFIERMPMGCGKNFGTYLPSQAVLDRCPELEPISHDGVAACYRLPDAKGTVGLIAPMSHAFCAECSRIRITADGKLKPCLHSDVEIALRGLSGEELEQAIRRGILMKPERHHMDETGVTETHRGMFAIGG